MRVVPMTLRQANDFVATHHRHNKPVRGCKFAIGALDGDELVGVAIVGRPLARMLDDGFTAEVLRVCVKDGVRNACSFLYGRAWRIWQQMGGRRMVTYTLQTEPGSSLRGAGWKVVGKTKAEPWSRAERQRDWQPIYEQTKLRWEVVND